MTTIGKVFVAVILVIIFAFIWLFVDFANNESENKIIIDELVKRYSDMPNLIIYNIKNDSLIGFAHKDSMVILSGDSLKYLSIDKFKYFKIEYDLLNKRESDE